MTSATRVIPSGERALEGPKLLVYIKFVMLEVNMCYPIR